GPRRRRLSGDRLGAGGWRLLQRGDRDGAGGEPARSPAAAGSVGVLEGELRDAGGRGIARGGRHGVFRRPAPAAAAAGGLARSFRRVSLLADPGRGRRAVPTGGPAGAVARRPGPGDAAV